VASIVANYMFASKHPNNASESSCSILLSFYLHQTTLGGDHYLLTILPILLCGLYQ
jgi:hypothetical protein